MRKGSIDKELLLNLWAAGATLDEVAARCGTMRNATISDYLMRARRAGDPRAVMRKRGQGLRESMSRGFDRAKRMRALSHLPAPTEADLQRAIESYQGSITKLPPGIHAGHVPICLKALGY